MIGILLLGIGSVLFLYGGLGEIPMITLSGFVLMVVSFFVVVFEGEKDWLFNRKAQEALRK